jgi:hypothetical protein
VIAALQWAWPLLLAALIGYAFDLDAIGFGAALGLGAFGALRLARRPLPFKFGALSLAGAVALGFIVAVLAALHGMPVRELMASGQAAVLLPKILGVAAVMLAVLGVACLLWGSFADT